MKRLLIIFVALSFLAVFAPLAGGAELPDPSKTRTDFEIMAAQMPGLALESVLYKRTNRFIGEEKQRDVHTRLLGKATDGTYPKEVLLDLLTHGDPKVRTLAAVALFDREDPSVLPALVKLCDDGADTFDGHGVLPELWTSGIGPPARKQTVGYVAKAMVEFYLKPSGFHYGVKGPPGFAEYWDARKNRAYCAAWFSVQLARASRGTSPTQNDCIGRIQAVRKRVDALPSDDNTWVLLWLNDGSDAFVKEEELIEACRKIGPDKLLLVLQNKIPSDDPDLQPRANNNGAYAKMSHFILRHAERLFRPGDSDSILACERWERDYQKHGISDPFISPWHAVAAAHLNSKNASAILHAAMDRFQGEYASAERSTLSVAMWQLAGRSETGFITDWFYKESLKHESYPNCRSAFIEAMREDPKGREIIAHIIQDARLDDIDWQSFERLVQVVNRWIKTPILTDEELRNVEQKKPRDPRDLRAYLSEWCKHLRIAMPN